ncbi:hypothetical protein [Caballeronia sp. BCC1704]|uniref:hypothetical protein n=1 Tax=Caballeronia sp. BCC1704 TaxID=2676300 RepID=UPI001589DABD|nr:hypothetical protein [Caballeronia sp. BCC1704]
MIVLQEEAVPFKGVAPFENGQGFRSVGGIIQSVRISRTYCDYQFLGIYGRLYPGDGYGAIFGGGVMLRADTKEMLAEFIREQYGRPDKLPEIRLERTPAPDSAHELMEDAWALMREIEEASGGGAKDPT